MSFCLVYCLLPLKYVLILNLYISGNYVTTRKRHVRVLDKEQASNYELENDVSKQGSFGAVCTEQNVQTHQVSDNRLHHVETQNSNIAVSKFV